MEEVLKASLGFEKADVVIEGSKLINVATGEIYESSIAIKYGTIIDVGEVEDLKSTSSKIIEADGLYVAPGFIDAHVHVESSHLTIAGFAEAAIPHGTVATVVDPHEIANVMGLEGVKAMIDEAEAFPFKVYFMAPSCVPSSSFETSGSKLGLGEVEVLLDRKEVLGLAEVMNYPEVLRMDGDTLAKIKLALERGKLIDGHCPNLRGRKLSAYLTAGARSDHESLSVDEAIEKLRKGAYLMVREGSSAKSLESILKEVVRQGLDLRRVMLVTDDIDARDLIQGHLNVLVAKAVGLGIDPIEAIRMVTLNPSNCFNLERRVGLVAPGWRANLVLLQDLKKFKVYGTLVDGSLLALRGTMLTGLVRKRYPEAFHHSVKLQPILDPLIFAIKVPLKKGIARVRVMVVKADTIVAEGAIATLDVEEGLVWPKQDVDVLQAGVVERHHGTGRLGLGFISGLGMEKGAVASSYAHDSHNIIVAGASWRDMCLAVNKLIELQGGCVVVAENKVEAVVRLEVAGLMSYGKPLDVAEAFSKVQDVLKSLGCKLPSPLQTLSFISLPVISHLRLTDRGLIDVEARAFVEPIVKLEAG